MAKDTVRDWDVTASNNTDIAGIGIQGTNAVSNFDGALRTLMAQVADVDGGVQPLNDTFTLCDPADTTKRVRIDAGNVAAATTRVLTMPNADVNISSFAATLLDDTTTAQALVTLGIEQFTWNPSLTFDTPGDLSVTYTTQVGRYLRIGNWVTISFNIATATFTHTTASGNLRIAGIPYGSASTIEYTGSVEADTFSLGAGYSWLNCQVPPGVSYARLIRSGTSINRATITTAQAPSGSNKTLMGSITYETV